VLTVTKPASVWLCNTCGRTGAWGPTWSWFGSLKDVEDGERIPTFCNDACKPNDDDLRAIRREVRRDPRFVLRPRTAEAVPS
jgi:hypothetical protein